MNIRHITLVGAAFLLIGLFLLPWVVFTTDTEYRQQIERALNGTNPNDIGLRDVLLSSPQRAQAVGLRVPEPGQPIQVEHLLAAPDLQQLAQLAQTRHGLSGWQLRGEPLVEPMLGLLLLLLLASALLALAVWAGAMVGMPVRVPSVALVLLSGALLLLLLSYLPTVDTLGRRDHFGLALVCWLEGSGTGAGIGVTLAGLGLVLGGALLELALSRPMPSAPES